MKIYDNGFTGERIQKEKNINGEDMSKMVSENIHEFLNAEDDFIPELPEMEGEDEEFLADEEGEEYIEIENTVDAMKKSFRAEMLTPEYSRLSFILQLKDGRILEGVPMAELSATDAFLFKIEGQIKKIRLEDIQKISLLEEESEEIVNEGYGEFTFGDYLYEIANFVEVSVPEWRDVIGEDGQDLVEWLDENQNLWDLQSLFAAGVPSDDVGIKILEEFQETEEEE